MGASAHLTIASIFFLYLASILLRYSGLISIAAKLNAEFFRPARWHSITVEVRIGTMSAGHAGSRRETGESTVSLGHTSHISRTNPRRTGWGVTAQARSGPRASVWPRNWLKEITVIFCVTC